MKLLICIITSVFVFAGGSRVVTFKELNQNYLVENKISLIALNSLKDGDFIHINSQKEFLLKTISRNLIVSELSVIEDYRLLSSIIEEKKDEMESIYENVTISEVIEDSNISITPFDPSDF